MTGGHGRLRACLQPGRWKPWAAHWPGPRAHEWRPCRRPSWQKRSRPLRCRPSQRRRPWQPPDWPGSGPGAGTNWPARNRRPVASCPGWPADPGPGPGLAGGRLLRDQPPQAVRQFGQRQQGEQLVRTQLAGPVPRALTAVPDVPGGQLPGRGGQRFAPALQQPCEPGAGWRPGPHQDQCAEDFLQVTTSRLGQARAPGPGGPRAHRRFQWRSAGAGISARRPLARAGPGRPGRREPAAALRPGRRNPCPARRRSPHVLRSPDAGRSTCIAGRGVQVGAQFARE